MDRTASVVERGDQGTGVDEQPPRFPRKGIDPDAEEVVQDALWAASRKIDTFQGTAAFGSWVYRITANAAYQKLRGRRSTRNEVSWQDLAPSFDDKGQH